jgi:hypothetical protein
LTTALQNGTGQLADNLAEKYWNRIHIIHRRERGRGTAGIAGFKYALGIAADFIVEMDRRLFSSPKLSLDKSVYILMIADGHRDRQALLQRRLLERSLECPSIFSWVQLISSDRS